MSMTFPAACGRFLLVLCLLLMALALQAGTALAQVEPEPWAEQNATRLDAAGGRLEARLLDAVAGLLSLGATLDAALADRADQIAEEPGAAFALLEGLLGRDPELMGLPLGAQIQRDGDVLAWAGWSLPASDEALAGRELMLRPFGAFQFLTLRATAPGGLTWLLDLPVASRTSGDSPNLPILLSAGAPIELELLPVVAAERGEAEGEAVAFEPLAGVRSERVRAWELRFAGRGVLELRLTGPGRDSFERGRVERGRRARGLLAFFAIFGLGLWLRRLQRRGRPEGLPLAWRAPLITLLFLLLRISLAYAAIPASFFPGSAFWNPRSFALDGLGGLFASSGDFLITALAALAVLLLVLRPYLRPAVEAQERWDEPTSVRPPGSRLLLLPALLGPVAGIYVAGVFARHVYRNSSPALLFDEQIFDPAALGLHLALFIAASFLLAICLSPAQLAWKRHSLGLVPRWLISLMLLAASLPLLGPAGVMALALLLPFVWGFRRASAELTGLVFHLFFLVCAVTLVTQDAGERARVEHERAALGDLARRADGQVEIWRSALLEETLITLAKDDGLRRELALPNRPGSQGALALWRASGMQELGERGGLDIYDARGVRRSRFQWGIDPPERRDAGRLGLERPDLWMAIDRQAGVGEATFLTGEIVLADPQGKPLGLLVLTLLDRRGSLQEQLAQLPWEKPSLFWKPRATPGAERLFIARLAGGSIVESSAPALRSEAERRLPTATGRWEKRSLAGHPYRVALLAGGKYLGGYRDKSALDSLLAIALRLFLHLLVFTALMALDLLFSRFPAVRRYLPPLIGPQGLGFQPKLLLAFLLVALLPTVLTGIIASNQLRRQYDEASQRTSLERVISARRSLENRVRQDATGLTRSEYIQSFIIPDSPPAPRDIGSLESTWVMIFDSADSLILDESLRNLSPSEAREFLAAQLPGRVVYEREGRRLFAGLLLPFEVHHRRQRVTGSLYYRMLLGEELVGDLADVVGGDLSLYRAGSLQHTNQPYLFGLGFQPPMLDPETVAELARGVEFRQGVGRAGGLNYGRASLPLRDASGGPVAVLSSFDFSGLASRQAALSRGGSVIFSMIAFLVVLALGLGGFLASRVFLPIRRLQLGTRRLAAGDLSHRLPPMGRDEIGDLVRSFNSMAGGLQEAQAELEAEQRFLESVLENVASGVLALDATGRVRSANPAALRLLRLSGASPVGKRLGELGDGEGGLDATPLVRFLEEHLTGPAVVTELSLPHPDGARSFRVASSDLASGRVAVFEDVTDLIRSQKLAAWSEMARQVAHEIKNPLTPIKLSAQHMERAWRDRRENFDEIFTDSVGTIIEQVEILRHIAQEFSLYGRRPQLTLAPVELSAALRDLLAPYAETALELRWTDETSATVLADADALRKVLLNLVENAREAQGGRGSLEIACLVDGAWGELRLRDRGSGIPAEALGRLFEPYFSSKTGGTGLGLAISAQFVEEMGGSLSLENHPEGGAIARLRLPLAN